MDSGCPDRAGESGVQDAAWGVGVVEPISRGEPGRGVRGDVDVASSGLGPAVGAFVPDDQLYRERQCSTGPTHGQGGPVAELGSEASVAGCGAAGHRAAVASGVWLQASGSPAGGAADASEGMSGTSGVTYGAARKSTKNGIDPFPRNGLVSQTWKQTLVGPVRKLGRTAVNGGWKV